MKKDTEKTIEKCDGNVKKKGNWDPGIPE